MKRVGEVVSSKPKHPRTKHASFLLAGNLHHDHFQYVKGSVIGPEHRRESGCSDNFRLF
jgi:hypothetical protein